MRPGYLEGFAVVVGVAYAITRDVCFLDAVRQHGIVSETAFPELVEHVHIFVGDSISLAIGDLLFETVVPCRAIQIRGDNVPCDPTFTQLVDSRESAGERIGFLVGGAGRDSKHQILCDCGHGGHEIERVIYGN